MVNRVEPRTGSPFDLDVLRAERCVAIARGEHARFCVQVAQALGGAGIRVLEFPLTTPGILDALPDVLAASRAGGTDSGWVGVGSILAVDQAAAAIEAGAEFLVTPTVDPEVVRFATTANCPVIVGAFTPTEIATAWSAGATAVKLFPASIGGPGLIRELRNGPLPEVPLVPTGGVGLDNVAAYLQAGAVALGIGGGLIGDALSSGDVEPLRDRAARFRAALNDVSGIADS